MHTRGETVLCIVVSPSKVQYPPDREWSSRNRRSKGEKVCPLAWAIKPRKHAERHRRIPRIAGRDGTTIERTRAHYEFNHAHAGPETSKLKRVPVQLLLITDRYRDRGRGEHSLAWHVTSIFTRAIDLFICRWTRERGFCVYRSRLSNWRDDGNDFQLIALMSRGRAECYRVCIGRQTFSDKKWWHWRIFTRSWSLAWRFEKKKITRNFICRYNDHHV